MMVKSAPRMVIKQGAAARRREAGRAAASWKMMTPICMLVACAVICQVGSIARDAAADDLTETQYRLGVLQRQNSETTERIARVTHPDALINAAERGEMKQVVSADVVWCQPASQVASLAAGTPDEASDRQR